MYYYSLNEYLKNTFGEKVYKISLDGGMTCPNRDGKIDTRGCIFCSRGGSGEFSASRNLSITEQIAQAKERIGRKTDCKKFIAYFQPFTNTYAPVEYLEKIFTEAIACPTKLSVCCQCSIKLNPCGWNSACRQFIKARQTIFAVGMT